jgi:hypothetical protein
MTDPLPSPPIGGEGASVAPIQPTKPGTRLQKGIRKEKVYTDGTIKYGRNAFLATSGEPWYLEEALGNKNQNIWL